MNFADFVEKLKSLLPDKKDSPEKAFFKITIYIIAGIILLMLIISLLIFFLNIDELEKTKVPNVTSNEFNKIDIINACLKIQEKGLNIRIQAKYSSQFTRGLVMDQRPRAGTSVKVGRYITLTVSNGPILNQVDNYIGLNITDVRLALQEAFASGTKAILQIEEPCEYESSPTVPVDHVIAQSPEPGTELVENKITYLKLKVSKGPEVYKTKVDNYLGQDFQTVIGQLYKDNILFTIEEETEKNTYKPGMISFQSLKAGENLIPGEPFKLKYNKPLNLTENEVYGRFDFVVREYDIPVPMQLDVSNGEGTRTLYSMKLKGGVISIPYILPLNSELTLYVLNKVAEKQIVQR